MIFEYEMVARGQIEWVTGTSFIIRTHHATFRTLFNIDAHPEAVKEEARLTLLSKGKNPDNYPDMIINKLKHKEIRQNGKD